MSDEGAKPVKQPYTPPTLVTYGDLTTLTQNTAPARPKFDGGAKLKTRTA